MSDSAAQFVELYLAESGRLQRRVSRIIGCRATASDIVHDVFLRLWKRKQNGMDEPKARAMLRSIIFGVSVSAPSTSSARFLNNASPPPPRRMTSSPHAIIYGTLTM
ncbi:RNA polymerase sigma factor [Nitrobacter winogradskyi]|uniref:Uncharacterized protein n=1 Tax=Nitrobacter winogradskyi TaxID=913 RepID=A0ACC6AHD8_NITWI|nr:sigma factor [Nitrobacter winogradskyi]MCP1999169.1 hypothetical protein [Nitrobacter winogradskyi]